MRYTPERFTSFWQITLAGDSRAFTLQSFDASRVLTVRAIEVWSSVPTSYDLERDGSEAEGDEVSVVKTTHGASKAKCFGSSNSAGGALISRKQAPSAVDMFGLSLRGGENFTIRFPIMTGTVRVTIVWEEEG